MRHSPEHLQQQQQPEPDGAARSAGTFFMEPKDLPLRKSSDK